MKENLIIIGMGEHGKIVAETILDTASYNLLGYLDDGEKGNIYGLKLLGNINSYEKYLNKNIKFHIAVGNNDIRKNISSKIGIKNLATIFHKTAYVSKFSSIEQGCYIGAMAVINQSATIGSNCIINTGSIIEHGVQIGKNSHISYRVLIGSNCNIEEESYIEMGEILKRNTNFRSKK